jgi:RecA-family ATPase
MFQNPENTPGKHPREQAYIPEANITAEDIMRDEEECLRRLREMPDEIGLLVMRDGNGWLDHSKGIPIPRMLFDNFWHEGELCILFADTNLGKSALAVQIGDSISHGAAIPGFVLEANAQPVLYCDFELGAKQFEARYSHEFQNHYSFSSNFKRLEMNADALPEAGEDFEALLALSIEEVIERTKAKVLIIDNLTYLRRATEKAMDALPLMKELKAMKAKYGLSILALAHTPKRDMSKPLTHNDLQGSKMLANFCDSLFTVGASSQDKSLRYLKQLKARNTEVVYDAENVCLCQIGKPVNFLQFEFLQHSREKEHLKEVKENERSELEIQIRELLASEPGITAYAITKRLCKEGDNFNSLQVKVGRVLKRITNTTNNY